MSSSNTDFEMNTYSAPRRPLRGLIVIVAALASLALCLAAVFFLAGGPKDARLAVNAAASATAKARTQKMAAACENIPALGLLLNGSGIEQGKSRLTLTFNSVSGVENAQQVTAMLTGSGVRADVIFGSGSLEMSAALSMLGQDLLDVYAYVSPGLVAAGIPAFSDTIVGFDPATLMRDLAAMGVLSEDDLRGFLSLESVPGATDPQADFAEIAAKLSEIYGDLMKSAEYTLESADNYKITLDGLAVKAAARELYALALSFGDRPDLSGTLADFDESVPAMPVEIALALADGAVRSFSAALRAEGGALTLTLSGELGDTRSVYSFEAAAFVGGDSASMTATAVETVTAERYSLAFDCALDSGDGAQSATALFTVNADDTYSLAADFASAATLDLRGKITKRGEVVTNDIGKLSIGLHDSRVSAEPVAVDFSLKSVTEPYSGGGAPSREYTLIADLGVDGLRELGEQYSAALEALLY